MNIHYAFLLLCPSPSISAFSSIYFVFSSSSSSRRLPTVTRLSLSNFCLPSSGYQLDCNGDNDGSIIRGIAQSQAFDDANDKIKQTIRIFQNFFKRWAVVSLSVAIVLSIFCTFVSLPSYAVDVASDVPSFVKELGLKPPTEDKPQIRLSEGVLNSLSTKTRTPILQGLVYFPERAKDKTIASASTLTSTTSKEPLDYYSDILVLTALSLKDPNGLVLAGAKFPVSSIRFPFSFSMYEQNLLLKRVGVKEAWEDVQNTSDVIIKAYICPSDALVFPCEDKEVKKYSEGVAKLITNLPGLSEGEVIRAPASLPL